MPSIKFTKIIETNSELSGEQTKLATLSLNHLRDFDSDCEEFFSAEAAQKCEFLKYESFSGEVFSSP